MTTVLHLHTSCESIVGLSLAETEWPHTKAYAEGASAFCLHCVPDCPMHLIAQMKSYQELLDALESNLLHCETPEPTEI